VRRNTFLAYTWLFSLVVAVIDPTRMHQNTNNKPKS
jgi:hypothetical protein